MTITTKAAMLDAIADAIVAAAETLGPDENLVLSQPIEIIEPIHFKVELQVLAPSAAEAYDNMLEALRYIFADPTDARDRTLPSRPHSLRHFAWRPLED